MNRRDIARSMVLVALDVDSKAKALALVAKLNGHVGGFKVGMETFNAVPDILQALPVGIKVFFDQKWHDILNTVKGVSKVAANHGIWMFNVMASGGSAMMKAAMEGVAEAVKGGAMAPLVIAVTLLTSIDQETLDRELRVTGLSPREYVVHLAKLAQDAGLDGVVASAKEAAAIREACGPDFLIVTPGIRPAGAEVNDQKRVATPADAVGNGANELVVGRPITGAEDPAVAADAIVDEIELALLGIDVALSVFNDKGIEFGEFRLKSHTKYPDAPLSPIFISLRKIGSSEEHVGKLSEETVDKMGELMARHFIDDIAAHEYITGIPSAGEPIVDAILRHLPAGTIKRLYLEKVGSGTERTIALKAGETYPEGATVLVVDDLITGADSKIEAFEALRAAGMIAKICCILVDRQQGGPEEAAAAGIEVKSIYLLDDLLGLFKRNGLITAEQIDEIHSYQQRFEEYKSTHEPVASG